MPIIFDGRLGDAGFSAYPSLQANGLVVSGSSSPNGIANRIDIASDPLGSGERVAQFTLYESDPPTAGTSSRRSEIRGPTQDPAGTEYWAMWSYLFPGVWADVRSGFSWMQWHDIPDGGDPSPGKPPPLLGVRAGNGLGQINASYHEDPVNPPLSDFVRRPLTYAWLPSGVWHTFVMRWLMSYTVGVGEREIWQNRRKIFAEFAQHNSYHDAQGPYFKVGLYNYFSVSGWKRYQGWSKGLVLGTGYSSFDEFMIACGSSDRELEGFVTTGVGLG